MFAVILILADDDIEIVTLLYETQSKKMYNIAFRILNKPEDAEEALYEAFLRIMDNVERINGLPYSARAPFCATIVKNISKNMLRGKNLQLSFDEVAYSVADSNPDPQQDFFARIDSAYLTQSINSLNPRDKNIILMKWAKKMKYKEIGQILGISEDAAMKRGQRALKRLQTIYFKESSYEKQF
jgi:RNA polymerase sigma-70 factor (ECF subfamily)